MCKFFLLGLFVSVPMFRIFGQSNPTPTPPPSQAASSVNAIGVDLLRATAIPGANALLSPYSIEMALAMTYAGTDGSTREEMARVLHLQGDNAQVATAFSELQNQLNGVAERSQQAADGMKKYGVTNDPIALLVANRLFAEKSYHFLPAYLDLVKTNYSAPLQAMDFVHDSGGATKTINDWVAEQTRQRIHDLIPGGALNPLTRLVLVNALYLKEPWANPFSESATKPLPFHVNGGAAVDVPTMNLQNSFGYARAQGVTVVSLPYSGEELQLLIVLPDKVNGLAKVEADLTADKLNGWASLPERDVKLSLPKFKMEPPTLPLGKVLQSLGMKTAFDVPPGSANFDRMAPRHLPNDYLYISDVFHKTFLSVDEKGTEAAAATAVMAVAKGIRMQPPKPVEVKVDHPFLFAIQHRASGACLFIGHVADPR